MHRRSGLLHFFLLLPMLYLLAMIGVPIVYTIVMSLQEVTLGNIGDFLRPFVGFDNFREALDDDVFRQVLRNSGIFVLVNVIGQVGLGTIAAACFAGGFRGANTMRGLLLAAWILPGLVVGTVWKWMFATQYGVVNFALSALGITRQPVHWLSDPAMSMTALNIAHVWFGMPFAMILIAAALSNIPGEHYEAAAIDGAGPIRRFRYITLPAIAPALLAVACLVIIASLRAFDVIFALTQGGPLNSTNLLPLLSYQASFQDFQFGRGAAIGSFAFVIVFGVALVYVQNPAAGATSMKPRLRASVPTMAAGALVVLYLFPLYWMMISGFKTQGEIFADPPSFFPRAPTLDAFRYVLGHQNMTRYIRNSIVIAVPVTFVTVALSAMGAYAMSRIRSRLVDAALVTVLLLQVFPEALLATPVFIIFKALNLLNTYTAVVLATSARAVAFGIVILRPMFRQVPFELEEASRVDGCSELQSFIRIVLPLMRVPLMVLAAITFTQAYGQFVYPLTLLNQPELQPGTVGIYGFIGAEIADWHRVMAFATVFVAPILLMFVLLQRHIVSGLTAGALK